jgi:pimeloyl-ACP methyl ester carboxylesterase
MEAHNAIEGSHLISMKGLGHFPMSKNPKQFLRYLLPVLNVIKNR